jgi:hypothetical protein
LEKSFAYPAGRKAKFFKVILAGEGNNKIVYSPNVRFNALFMKHSEIKCAFKRF